MVVHVLESVVVKADTGHCATEAAKLAGYRAFAGAMLRVPEVIFVDDERDVAVFERLDGYASIQRAYLVAAADPRVAEQWFAAAGRALAWLHLHSSVRNDWVRELSGCSERSGPLLLHGDFGFSNVWIGCKAGDIAIIDPVPPAGDGSHPLVFGAPIEDLALMMSCLLGRLPPNRLAAVTAIPRRTLMRAYLSGYGELADPSCSFDEAVHAGARALDAYLRRRRWAPAYLVRPLVSRLLSTL